MSVIKSDASLRGKVRQFAKEHRLKPQEVLQIYLFEHLLMRLEKSAFVDKFILKGGLLISSMVGIHQRTTMDMDATVVGLAMDEQTMVGVMKEICAAPVNDGMKYEFKRLEPIRESDIYANWRAHLKVRYGRIDAPIKVDITTGDSLYPSQVMYPFRLMFDEGLLDVFSYHPATVFAEKLETVLSRGAANTRGRDYYDLYLLPRVYAGKVNIGDIEKALVHTGRKRNSLAAIANWRETMADVRSSVSMQNVWEAYIRNAPYAEGVSLDDAVRSVEQIMAETGL